MKTVSFVQMTDIHLLADPQQDYNGINTYQSLQSVLKKVQELPKKPDFLLLTGDLSQDGTPESYQHLKKTIAPLQIPTYCIPGNHDDLEIMTDILPSERIYLENSFIAGHWRILLLNSVIVGETCGRLSSETLLWLKQKLEQNQECPVLIALHHPPFPINLGWKKSILQEPENLLEVINAYPQVKLVIAGHVHQAYCHQNKEIHYLTTPSTCIQFDEPSCDSLEDWESPQPGFRLIELRNDGSFETFVERIEGDF